jgi:hypothetical protein
VQEAPEFLPTTQTKEILMLNTMRQLMIVAVLLVFAVPAYSGGQAMQIFYCNQDEDASDEQVDEIAMAWLKAARTMKGGENLQGYLRFPVAADAGENDFVFVLIAPSFAEWGTFTDGYAGSPAEDVDEKFEELADCTRSTLWESFEVK